MKLMVDFSRRMFLTKLVAQYKPFLKAGDVTQWESGMLSIYKALGSVPSTAKNKNKKREGKRESKVENNLSLWL